MKTEIPKRKRIIVVDNEKIILEGIKTIFLTTGFAEEVLCFQSIEELINCNISDIDDEIALLNFSKEDASTCIRVEEIVNKYPKMRMIALTDCIRLMNCEKALRCGLKGVALKTVGILEIEKAIRVVESGETFVSQDH
jgi:DNA-binding NarL/FixJ family response regulator